MKKFFLGLGLALVLGIVINIAVGYTKYGYWQKLFKPSGDTSQGIDKDIKECKSLASSASGFGSLKVTIIGNGKPVEGLEVDLSDKPGPVRCIQKTDSNGVALFTNVPAERMVIFFNSGNFPKDLGKDPMVYIDISKDQTIEKLLTLPQKQ